MGSIVPYNGTERTMKTSDFLALHNVFLLDEAAKEKIKLNVTTI